MNISEREIFDFIFFPELLDKEKFLFLSKTDLFNNELNLLKNIKEQYNQPLSEAIIHEIKSKIAKLSSNNIIRLEKKKILLNASNQLVLAAESHLNNNKQKIETFEDRNSLFLVKVVLDEDLKKIYLFTRDNIQYTNLRIIVEPTGNNYIFENSNIPIIVYDREKITGISIITPD